MERGLERRAFLRGLAAGVAATAGCGPGAATAAEVQRATFTYKTVGDCAIKANVTRAATREKLPVAVWIHGGALIMGDRHGIDSTLRNALVNAGYVVVSIDYRLAPKRSSRESSRMSGMLLRGSVRMGRASSARGPIGSLSWAARLAAT